VDFPLTGPLGKREISTPVENLTSRPVTAAKIIWKTSVAEVPRSVFIHFLYFGFSRVLSFFLSFLISLLSCNTFL
jgi:ABC-type arginine transport system permease subunit